MLVSLYLLRRDGARIPDRDWKNSPRIGSINLSTVATARQLSFQPDGTQLSGIGLTLFEPQLTHLGDRRLRFRGFEVIGGEKGRAVVQEWLCELYDRPMPAVSLAYADRGTASPGSS